MSLIHWWPLNGDLKDYIRGNDLIYINNNGRLVSDDNGKLGKCWKRTAVNTEDTLRSKDKIKECAQQSITAWVLVTVIANTRTANGLITNHDHETNTGFGLTLKTDSNGNAFISCNSGNGSSRTYNDYYGTTNLVGSWHHLCGTYDGANIRLYVDGILEKTQAYSMKFKEDYLDIFNWSTAYHTEPDYRPAASICDVRVYDHALSYPEIQELKRACIVHYNFEGNFFDGPDLVESKDWNNSSFYSYDGSGQGSIGTHVKQSDGRILITDTNSNTRIQYLKLIECKKNDIFSVSIKYEFVSGNNKSFKWQIQELDDSNNVLFTNWTSGNSENGTTIYKDAIRNDIGDGWELLSYTFNIQKDGTKKIRFWLQDGDDYTTYTHSYYLKDFSIFKDNYEHQYDCSGYCNHASVHGVEKTSNSVIGSSAVYFKDGQQWLEHTGAPYSDSELSYVIWFKTSNTSPKNRYHIPFTIDSGRVEFSIPEGNPGQLRWGGYIDGNENRYCNNTTCINKEGETISLSDGKWHCLVSVFDGNGFKAYIDGKYQGKQGLKDSKTGLITYVDRKLLIGKYSSGAETQYGATDMYIGEVRVYNTILTDEDITELYNHTVKITNNKTMISNFFKEDKNTNIRIHESGMVSCNEIYNRINNTKINGFRFKDNENNSSNLEITDITEI